MPPTYTPGQWRRTRSELGVLARRDPQADLDPLRRQLQVEHFADQVAQLAPLAPAERALIASAGKANR